MTSGEIRTLVDQAPFIEKVKKLGIPIPGNFEVLKNIGPCIIPWVHANELGNLIVSYISLYELYNTIREWENKFETNLSEATRLAKGFDLRTSHFPPMSMEELTYELEYLRKLDKEWFVEEDAYAFKVRNEAKENGFSGYRNASIETLSTKNSTARRNIESNISNRNFIQGTRNWDWNF
jgi:hypothetical protein